MNERRTSSFVIAEIVHWLTRPSAKMTDPAERRKAQTASSLALLTTGLALVGNLFAVQVIPNRMISPIWLTVLISLTAFIISRTRFYAAGMFLLSLGLSAFAYINVLVENRPIERSILLFAPLALIIASSMLSSWALFLLTGLNVAGILLLLPALGVTLPNNIGGTAGLITTVGLVLVLINNFRQSIENQRLKEFEKTNQELLDIRENLEKRVEERTQELNRRSMQLEASTLVARSAAMVRDLNELLESVVGQITERFGYYHTGIFLTDSAEKSVVLQAASSEGGRLLLKRGLKLDIGRQGVVGYAAYQKRPRIVQDVSADSTYIPLPELPQTRSEAALPLIVRNRVIGVLDIQSEESNAFKFDDIYTLQTMADQVALAIDNTILLEESRAALLQLETINASNAANTWKTRLQGGPLRFTYTPLGISSASGHNGGEESDNIKTISVPLNLRGKSIGTISLKRKANDPNWAESEREMAERIASQVALAVENARLLEESQRRAAREQKVSEFSNRFSRSLDIDSLLQNAVRELHSLPQVEEVSVFINPEKKTEQAH